MSDARFTPRFITFDCYGTLTHFQANDVARRLFAERVEPDAMPAFLEDFTAYRRDEVLGPYKPYPRVLADALQRACARRGVAYRDEDGAAVAAAVPTWGPHPDVPAALARLAERFPLVILSNAADDQIGENVRRLGAPFHAVYTAEQIGAYKPRMQGFEYMLERLDCGPDEILHVSSSLYYDLIPAHGLRIVNKVYVNRGYEPSVPFYGYAEVASLEKVPALVGA